MAQYTIEDIEILRQKSGISYEEAVNLLEYHNGSLARALVDLEKNGRLRDAKPRGYNESHGNRRQRHHLFNTLFLVRLKVYKGEIPILNLSLMFFIFSLMVASWLVIFSAMVALLMGYRFAVERDEATFGKETLEDIVKNAGSNARNTVFTMARDFGAFDGPKDNNKKSAEPEAPVEPEKRTEQPASGTTPVSVKYSEDGPVRVTENEDGYHEADIQ